MPTKQKEHIKAIGKKPQDKVSLRIAILLAWLLAGLYFGSAGWAKIYYDALAERANVAHSKVDCSDPKVGVTHGGISYCTQDDYSTVQQLQLMESTKLDWIFYIPDPLPMILSAFAFGVIGNQVRMIRAAIGKKTLSDFYTLSFSPSMGGMTALMLLGASYLFPSSFSNVLIRPTVVPFLSLFAGVFSEHIQRWFQSIIDKFFNVKKEND
jgi:hypothetical protein